jgi:hypothetical protein
MSVVSDISKSAFFGGVNESGIVQMHYPSEHVRLIMQNSLPRGVVYCHPIDNAVYENYHNIAEQMQLLHWENFDDEEEYGTREFLVPLSDNIKGLSPSSCPRCGGTGTKTDDLLPPNHYVINVPDDIYCRLLDEIIASGQMPCGLYFCGHHEDVSTPSIWIAFCIVFLLLTLMTVAATLTPE